MKPPESTPKARVVDLKASIEALEALPVEERVRVAMQIASHFLEYAGFEMALERDPGDVSEIILMAARLDMAAGRRKGTIFSGKSAQLHRKM